jgi:CRP-like cAMP-binding protein
LKGTKIRRATAADAPKWLDLVQATLGAQYPVKAIYDPGWIANELDAEKGQETWVAEVDGRFNGSISFLKPDKVSSNPVANLGRNLFRPESVADGSAEMLLRSVKDLTVQRNEMAIVRIAATDNAQQILFENLGYVCVGFQPLKHMLQERVGVLFYVHGANPVLVTRIPLSESLPDVSELGAAVLEKLQIPNTMVVRDGASGYPLQCDLKMHEATIEECQKWRIQAERSNPPAEVSGRFNYGLGLMRIPGNPPMRALLGEQDKKMVTGLSYYFDEQDRCARVTEAFCSDDISMGALLAHALRLMQEQLNAVYTEVDILAAAPRLLKSAEQLGFVPVAYLPAFFSDKGRLLDVVKMVKLNLPYSLESGEFTAHAKSMVKIIDRIFEDQKLGLAIINMLRPLSMFAGLGDGELRKIARLFTQKLYRADEQIFAKGDSGDEAFIVLRGKISIKLEAEAPAVAQLGDGKVFGEMAFLDGAPRAAFAIAAQPSILLVLKRKAFAEVVRREPGLGMVVMRNLAQDLALKLRAVNEVLASVKKPPAKT